MSFVIRNGLLVPKREIIRRKTKHLRVPHAPLILRRIHCPIVKPITSAVTLDHNPAADVSGSSVSTLSLTNFTVGTGSNRALIALFCYVTGATAISVTWDPTGANQSLTRIITANDAAAVVTAELWGLVNPTSGVNKTITANWTTAVSSSALSAISFNGVNQTGGATSFAHSASNTGSIAVSGTGSVSITTATANAVVAATSVNSLAISAVNNTQIFIDGTTIFAGNFETGGASPQSMTSTIGGGTCGGGDWVMVGVDVVAAASGDTLGGPMQMRYM